MGMHSAATSFKKATNSPLSLCSPKFLTTSGINDWIISMSSLLFWNRIFRFRRLNFALFHAFFISNLGVLLLVIGVEWPFGDSFVISPFLTLWNFIHLSSFHPMEWQWRFTEMPIINYAIGNFNIQIPFLTWNSKWSCILRSPYIIYTISLNFCDLCYSTSQIHFACRTNPKTCINFN